MEQGYIYINNNIFPTLLAISEEEQVRGLMGQEWPPPNMAFIYSTAQVNKFWMSNTPSPLDIIFCYGGEITQICYGEPYSTAVVGDHRLSDLVIELPHGTVMSSEIKLAHKVGIVKPTAIQLQKIIAQKAPRIVKI